MLTGLQQSLDMQQVVRLLGDLGDRYGVEHTYYDLRTPADAVKLLCINIPELQEELIHAHEHGIGYRLIQADTDLGYEDLHLPIGSNDLILTPVIVGSGGGGVGQILAGVALVAAAIFIGPAAAGFLGLGAGLVSGATAAAASVALGAIGTSLILGGVAQLLSPQPTIPTLSAGAFGASGVASNNRLSSAEATSTDGPQSIVRGTDGRQSYAYTGAANTVGVGATIPVAYGEVLIGSQLLSANIEVTDESDPLKTTIKQPGVDTVLFGGEKLSYIYSNASGVDARTSTATLRRSDSQKKVANLLRFVRDGITITGGDEVDKKSNFSDSFDFLFELQDGLFDTVSGPGSTLVDGFITYRLTLTGYFDGAPSQVIGTSQGTIQGLLLAGQRYKWMHRMEHSDTTQLQRIRPKIEIVDHKTDDSCTLFWQSYGYRLNGLG